MKKKARESFFDEIVFFNNCFTETFSTSSLFYNFALFKFHVY